MKEYEKLTLENFAQGAAKELFQVEDDGISQVATGRAGVTLKSKIEIKNPITLLPYRSFPDIDPEPEKLIFRVHKDGRFAELALYESSSGIKELKIMESIKNHLTSKLKDVLVV